MYCYVLLRIVMYGYELFCIVMYCYVLLCIVLCCYVLFCVVTYCYVLLCMVMDGWMDEWMDGWMNGWMDGWMHVCLFRSTHIYIIQSNLTGSDHILSIHPRHGQHYQGAMIKAQDTQVSSSSRLTSGAGCGKSTENHGFSS